MQEIGSVKQKIANNHQGKFDASKVPPITADSLRLLIREKSAPKNPLE
jgi:hypothetical protein